MNDRQISLKVAKDVFLIKIIWTLAFLGIVLIVNIAKVGYAYFQGNETEGFFNTSFVASNFFMFIIGLLAIEFLPYFVGIGVTRKDYFIGTSIQTFGLALGIAIITSFIFLVEKFILKLIDLPYKTQNINELDLDGNILGDTIQMIILSPYVDPHENLMLATFILFTNVLILYVLGWMISSAFYSHGTVYGLVSVLIAIIIKMLKDNLLRVALDLPTIGWLKDIPDMPAPVAFILIYVIIILIFYAIRLNTKRVTVKL